MYLFLILFVCVVPLGAILFTLTEPYEGKTFFEKLSLSIWLTIFGVIPFGIFGDVVPNTPIGSFFSILLRIYCLVCLGGAIYSALQASLFEQIDRITGEHMGDLVEKPMDIFISYRRADSAGHSGRIYDRLSSVFGAEHVFMDIDTIIPGEDFIQVIEKTISACDLIVAVVGPDWTGGDDGGSRIFHPNDFVRLEIKHALDNKIPVIPVLINQARMPIAAELPEDIQGILDQPTILLNDKQWNSDVQKLLDGIVATGKRRDDFQTAT
jgi:TIR domain